MDHDDLQDFTPPWDGWDIIRPLVIFALGAACGILLVVCGWRR